ncbi:hypothetical protein Rhopal_000591-T1 [Rhodotorula paludigena]|uniref:Uncharacterized protein n=1 Tax=Rhodotorula paludigena TaxID=86838 RepID=A0AAV5G567_9BASI|nr:hypothetical protein Rhopal_000591-T1 [Rhodotorula paludigena]
MPENRLHKGLYCDANREVKSCGEGVNNCDINGRRLSCFPGYYANLRDGTCTKTCPGSKPITDPFPMCDPCPTQGGYPAWLADSQTCVTPPTCGPAYDMFDSAGNYVRTEPATWLDRSTNVCRTCNTGSGNAYSCTDFGSPIYCYDSYRYKAYCVNTCTSGMPASDSDISGADIPAEFLQRHTIGKNCFFGY